MGDAEVRVDGKGGEDRGDARKSGAVGGVAAAAGRRWAGRSGRSGGRRERRIFQEAVAGFEQPGYPFRATLYGFYDFTRLQWMLVERLLSSGLLDEVYFPGLFDDGGTFVRRSCTPPGRGIACAPPSRETWSS